MSETLTTAEVLTTASGYIRRGWTRHTLARNRYRTRVPVTDAEACRFCALGAVYRAAGVNPTWARLDRHAAYYRAIAWLNQAANEAGYASIAELNDKARSKGTVLHAYDRAIALAATAPEETR